MTVSELIEQLQKLPKDSKVWISSKNDKAACAIKEIKAVDRPDEFIKPFVHIITSDRI